ncbi:hypothetical protein BLNAU_23524 [Blattamonas nauphoetae]|uniref:Uncharacterized protein n=1 Tax=Blattamonas nauphoetae TaxID=2049346 RepID=A0ABQ9WSY7_9EUKA|nr:hypothetical protein BLNAU_23524 [Blattamonas nauphoetae]
MQRSRMRNRMELAGRASGRVSKVDGTDRSKVEENERQSINQTVLSSQIPSIPESLVICSGSSLGYLASLLVTMRRLQHLGQLSVRLRVIIWISNGRELSTLEVLRQTISEILDDPTPHTNTEILTDDTPLISRRHTTEYGEKGFVGASNDDSTPQKKEHEPTHLQNSLSTPLADSEAEFEVPSAHIPALAQQDDQISQAQLSTFSDSPSVKSRFLSQQKHFAGLQNSPDSPLRLLLSFGGGIDEGSEAEQGASPSHPTRILSSYVRLQAGRALIKSIVGR